MRRTATIEDNAPDLGDLYEREGPRMWRAVFAYAQDRAVIDDAVAEAFAQCLRRGEEVRSPRAFVETLPSPVRSKQCPRVVMGRSRRTCLLALALVIGACTKADTKESASPAKATPSMVVEDVRIPRSVPSDLRITSRWAWLIPRLEARK
jgi:hypothetical protein